MGLMCLRGKVRELAPEIYKVTTLCLKIQVRWAGERSKKRVEDRKRKAPREREREKLWELNQSSGFQARL